MKTQMLNVTLTYHYAHANRYTKRPLVDKSEIDFGIIKFLDSESDTQPIKVKFSPADVRSCSIFSNINSYNTGINNNTRIDIDNYSGIVSIYWGTNNHPVLYEASKGYHTYTMIQRTNNEVTPGVKVGGSGGLYFKYNPSFHLVSGYIYENAPLVSLFNNKFAFIENYPEGKLKIYTSIYDKGGYVMKISPDLIKEIISSAENSSSYSLSDVRISEAKLQAAEAKLAEIEQAKQVKREAKEAKIKEAEKIKAEKAAAKQKALEEEKVKEYLAEIDLKEAQLFKVGEQKEGNGDYNEIIREVSKLIRDGNDHLRVISKKATLLLGDTGAGKSTLAHLLSGRQLQAIVDDETGELVVDAMQPIDGMSIGHKMASNTKIPNKCLAANNSVIWDCPGFNDTETVQEIANSFHIKRLFEHGKRI